MEIEPKNPLLPPPGMVAAPPGVGELSDQKLNAKGLAEHSEGGYTINMESKGYMPAEVCKAPAVDPSSKTAQTAKLIRKYASFFYTSAILRLAEAPFKLVAKALVTGFTVGEQVRVDSLNDFYGKNQERRVEPLKVQTSDGVTLDAMVIHPKPKEGVKIDNTRCILMLHGNGARYECDDLEQAAKFADDTGQAVYVFNYRGSGRSSGPNATSMNDYVHDARSMMQMICEKQGGIEEKSISLYGHSMGGAIAAKAAAKEEANGIKTRLVADRSLASVSLVTESFVKNLGTSKVGRVGFAALGKLAGVLVKALGWETRVYKNIRELDPNKVCINFHPHDQIIRKGPASLSDRFKDDRYKLNVSRFRSREEVQDGLDIVNSNIRDIENKTNSNKQKINNQEAGVNRVIQGVDNILSELNKPSIEGRRKLGLSPYIGIILTRIDDALQLESIDPKVKKDLESARTALETIQGKFKLNVAEIKELEKQKKNLEDKKSELSKTKSNKKYHGRSLWREEALHTEAVNLFRSDF